MQTKEALRRRYARLVAAASPAAQGNARLIDAFATVGREDFLGPGPWQVLTRSGYEETPSSHPERLYRDVLVALDSDRRINNGQPSLHAACLAALDVRPGKDVVHVGTGSGYYTAILAELATPAGRVEAYEVEDALAQAARRNLADRANVVVHHRSGVEAALPASDAVYVSAGATHPVRGWLDALRPGGRLLFPLTGARDGGGMLLVRRIGTSAFAARFASPARFVPCTGARDEGTGRRLDEVFGRGDAEMVRSLRAGGSPDGSCWVAGEGWWLSRAAPAEEDVSEGREPMPRHG